MKKVLILLLLMSCWSCYDDDLLVLEDDENNLHKTSELTQLLRGVSSHNTTFDQFIDGSTCFSIEFPYQIKLNDGSILNIETIEDLREFATHDYQNFDFLYPLQIKTADYKNHQIDHKNKHLELLMQCNDGEMFKNHIDCASLVFPLTIAVLNTQTNRFHQLEMTSAKELYNYLSEISENARYKIEYPIDLIMYDEITQKSFDNLSLFEFIEEAEKEKCSIIN